MITADLLKRDWFQFCSEAPDGKDVRRCRYWDLSCSDSHYAVGAKLSNKGGKFYIENLQRGRWAPSYRDEILKQTAAIDGKSVAIRIEKEPGASGLRLCKLFVRMLPGWDVKGITPTSSKVSRMQGFASQAEVGNVYIVRRENEHMRWIEEMLGEFENFPVGEHDDIVDACSGAFNYLAKPKKD